MKRIPHSPLLSASDELARLRELLDRLQEQSALLQRDLDELEEALQAWGQTASQPVPTPSSGALWLIPGLCALLLCALVLLLLHMRANRQGKRARPRPGGSRSAPPFPQDHRTEDPAPPTGGTEPLDRIHPLTRDPEPPIPPPEPALSLPEEILRYCARGGQFQLPEGGWYAGVNYSDRQSISIGSTPFVLHEADAASGAYLVTREGAVYPNPLLLRQLTDPAENPAASEKARINLLGKAFALQYVSRGGTPAPLASFASLRGGSVAAVIPIRGTLLDRRRIQLTAAKGTLIFQH